MNSAHSIISTLNKEIIETNKQLEKFLQSPTSHKDIKQLIDFLNETIRKLDHAVEKLTDLT